ncbi:hypothetical protein HKD37_10G028609 [Glycine soja]
MVRIRRFGWTLDSIIGRALGREVSGDADEALQWQQEATHVAKDVQYMDHAANEPEEIAVDDVVPDVEGFLGGSYDTLVLIDYVHHVAERPELNPLIACFLNTGDQGLISTFAERWHKKTSIFHLTVQEVTITFNDVASLLHLPMTSAFYSFEALHMDKVVLLLVELLEVSVDECWIYEHFPSVTESIAAKDYDERKPRACCWNSGKALSVSTYRKRIDRLTSDVVC